MGLNLPVSDLEVLEARTEGWVTGLQLAALSLRGQERPTNFMEAFTGANSYILDYLSEEALLQQPEGVQHFLLQTSVAERMCGSLCDFLTGGSGAQAMLQWLEQHN